MKAGGLFFCLRGVAEGAERLKKEGFKPRILEATENLETERPGNRSTEEVLILYNL